MAIRVVGRASLQRIIFPLPACLPVGRGSGSADRWVAQPGLPSPLMVEINLFRNEPDAVVLREGEVLFAAGDPADAMFAVIEGGIDVVHGDVVLNHIGAGGILGEMGLMDHAPRSATAVATESSRVARLDERRFLYLVQQHPTFALLVMRVLAERLRRNTTPGTPAADH